MDIRQATVGPRPTHSSSLRLTIPFFARQIDDLLGMQKANLLNLPENYTFKYCKSLILNACDLKLLLADLLAIPAPNSTLHRITYA